MDTYNGFDRKEKRSKPEDMLTLWRTKIFDGLRVSTHQEAVGEWPDQKSIKAEKHIRSQGADIPWSYGQRFGDKNFKVTGLRAGGIGVVLLIETNTVNEKKFYAAKTLLPFLKPEYLQKPIQEQEHISKAFLEEALPWLEMGQHPHIVPVLLLEKIIHLGFNRNIPFIFSLYMSKGSLREYLDQKRVNLKESLSLCIQLCDGLLHAYKHGLSAHLDLKPENIMVHDDGIFRLMDFSSGVIGSPGYMAPEQVAVLWQKRGEGFITKDIPQDHRADQFVLGIILLEALKGEHPFDICFDACISPEWANEYLNKGVGSLKDNSSIPKDLKKLLSRILSPAPEARFPDMAILKAKLLELYERDFGRYRAPEVPVDYSANWYLERGKAFYTLGRYAAAEKPFKKALDIFRSIPGTELEQAHCISNLGTIYLYTSRFEETMSAIEKAYNIYRHLPNTEFELANCIGVLGMLYLQTGRFEESISAFSLTLDLLRMIPGTECDQAKYAINIGNIYLQIGNFEEGILALEDGLDIFRSIPGTELEQAHCMQNLGLIYLRTGRFDKAISFLQKVSRILCSIPGTEYDQARCENNIGVIYLELGKFDNAIKIFKKTLETYSSIPGTELDQAKCTVNLGNTYKAAGRFEEAKQAYERAINIYKSIPNTQLYLANCAINLGSLYRHIGHYDDAISVLKDALNIYRTIPGTELSQATCTMNLGNVYRDLGYFKKAISLLKDALDIYQRIADTELDQARCASNLVSCYEGIGDTDKAFQYAVHALKLCEPFPPEATFAIRSPCITFLERMNII